VCHAGDNLLTGKCIENDDWFAVMSRQAKSIVIDFIDSQSQSQFFGAVFW
jgi:hypothetical protein